MKMKIKDLDQWLVKVVFSGIFIYSNIFHVKSPVFDEVTLCLIISYASLASVLVLLSDRPTHVQTIVM